MDPAQYDPNRGGPGGYGPDGGDFGPGRGGPGPGGFGPGGQYRGEKQDEKEQEKRREKGGGLDEKYRRDPTGFVGWVFLLIWLGVNLLLQNLDVGVFGEGGGRQWAVFAWGGAVIIFFEVLVRMAVPRWRTTPMGALVWGAIWAGVGFGLWYDKWAIIGPIVIIAVGLAILLGRLLPRR